MVFETARYEVSTPTARTTDLFDDAAVQMAMADRVCHQIAAKISQLLLKLKHTGIFRSLIKGLLHVLAVLCARGVVNADVRPACVTCLGNHPFLGANAC